MSDPGNTGFIKILDILLKGGNFFGPWQQCECLLRASKIRVRYLLDYIYI